MTRGRCGDGGMCRAEPAKGTMLLAWLGPGHMGSGQSQGEFSGGGHTEF